MLEGPVAITWVIGEISCHIMDALEGELPYGVAEGVSCSSKGS